jgi:hypothetical protein
VSLTVTRLTANVGAEIAGLPGRELVDPGEVVVAPTGEHELPEIQTITSDPDKTNPALAAFRRGNFLWHSDAVRTHLEWDNTGMLHRAMPLEPTSRRLLHRTTLVGTEAVA